jgi:uncharacterized membrane protein
MIETHVINLGLRPDLRAGSCYHYLNETNGLVAPLFIVLTGFLLEFKAPQTFWDFELRFLRAGRWLLLGWLLNLPVWNPDHHALDFTPLVRMDILQLLAISAMFLTVLQIQNEKRRHLEYLFLVALVLFLTLLLDRWPLTRGTALTQFGWVSFSSLSLFPLLPWLAFALAGAWLARFLSVSDPKARRERWRAALATCASLSAILFILFRNGCSDSWTIDIRANPLFAGWRIAFILLLILAFLRWPQRWNGLPVRILCWFGRHSLAIYVVHLLVISDHLPGQLPVSDLISGRLDFRSVFVVTAALAAGAAGTILLGRSLVHKIRLALVQVAVT